MGWLVRLHYDVTTDGHELFVFREGTREGTDRRWEFWVQDAHSDVPKIEQGTQMRPFLRLGFHNDGRDVLSGLAAQLSQHGYGALDSAPTIRALQQHIASLEKQVERLFTLANRGNGAA